MKKWSLRYELFKRGLSFAFSRFYRNIEVIGKTNIPKSGPVIYCENHTNAVIDPVIIAAKQPRQPGFLARSDVFNNKILDRIFRGFKMLPVYRQRDNVNTVKANQPIFNAVVNHLSKDGAFIIAPEGNKGIDQHLLPLKKGTARIAIQKMNKLNWDSNLCIVPVGLTYSGYDSCNEEAILRFGKPIYIKSFKKVYEQNPNHIFKIITNRLTNDLKPLMWNIEEKSWLPWMYQLKQLNGEKSKFSERMEWCYVTLRRLQKKDEEQLKKIQYLLYSYLTALKANQIDDSNVIKSSNTSKFASFILTLILAPFFALHKAFHIMPRLLGKWILQRLAPHPHFLASMLFGLLFVLIPAFYLVYLFLVWFISGSWWLAIGTILLLPMLTPAAHSWNRHWGSLRVSAALILQRGELMNHLNS